MNTVGRFRYPRSCVLALGFALWLYPVIGNAEAISFVSIGDTIRTLVEYKMLSRVGAFACFTALCLLVVVSMNTIKTHKWVLRVSFAGLLLTLTFGLLFELHEDRAARKQSTTSSAVVRAYIERGGVVTSRTFTICLKDVDTLKANPKKTIAPWSTNYFVFKDSGLDLFLSAGRDRLRSEFSNVTGAILQAWPSIEQYREVLAAESPSASWDALRSGLTNAVVVSRWTGETNTLLDAFSTWPLAHVTVGMDGSCSNLNDGWFPQGHELSLTNSSGGAFTLEIQGIFNGSRAIGEPEACVIEIRRAIAD